EEPASPDTEADDDAETQDEVAAEDEDEDDDGDESDFGPPFVAKTFGGSFVWAKGEAFQATVLRVKEGKTVPVATQNRRDMYIMLTGGRAVMEILEGDEVEREEL